MRTVGAYLDEFAESQLSVIETPAGFAVRTEPEGSGHEPALIEFAYDDLLDRTALLARRRGRGKMAGAKRRVLGHEHGAVSTLYQDLLRALGWELDESAAYNVLLEEVDGNFWVSYVALDRDNDYTWRKRSVRLGVPELQEMLNDAVQRRLQSPLLRRTKLAQNPFA